MKTKKSSRLSNTKKTKKQTNSKPKLESVVNNPILDENKIKQFTTHIGKCNVNFVTYNQGKIPNTKQYKIISIAYFIMSTALEMSKYKKYLEGLNTLIKTANKKVSDYKVRIYCDIRAFNKLKEQYNNKLVEFFVYDIPQFHYYDKQAKGVFHHGYIGTMMRFLPFFKYPEHNVDIVVNLDIDNILEFNIIKLINTEVYKHCFMYKNKHCYNNNPRMIKLGFIKYPVVASFISMNKNKLAIPNNVLNQFFNTHLLKDDERYMIYLKHIDTDILFKTGAHKIANKSINKFMYGIDEYFINYNLFKWFKKNNIRITPFILRVYVKNSFYILSDLLTQLFTESKYSNTIKITIFNIVKNYFLESMKYYNYPSKDITTENFETIINEYGEYCNAEHFNNLKRFQKNKKLLNNIIHSNKTLIKNLLQYKKYLKLSLQEFECLKGNIILNYNDVNSNYKLIPIKLNDINCYFYSIKQILNNQITLL